MGEHFCTSCGDWFGTEQECIDHEAVCKGVKEKKYNIGNFKIGNLFVDKETFDLHEELETANTELLRLDDRLEQLYDTDVDSDDPEQEEQEVKKVENRIKSLLKTKTELEIKFRERMKKMYSDYGKVIL